MSQLLRHPFPGHWQTQSCPDGVLIHNAAAGIIPSSHTLLSFCSSSSSFSLLYQTSNRSSLSRTLPPYCSFHSDQKVNSHTRIGHSPCCHWSLASFSMRCLCSVSEPHRHICEKASAKLQYRFFAAPQNSLQKYLFIKWVLPMVMLQVGSSGCLWDLSAKGNCIKKEMPWHQKLPETPIEASA